MSDDILKSLEILKGKIDNSKSIRNQVDAEIKWNMQKIKESFDCDTIEEAEGLLVEMLEEAEQKKKIISTQHAALVKEAQQRGLI